MKKRIVQEILLKAPFAYAHHKIQFDSNKKVVNYIFQDINLAFEEMTGLKREEILGKSVEEILPSITKGSFDWEGFYGKVTILDERHEITCYLEPLDHWYKIIVFSLKQGHFVTLFQNITAEVKQVEILENHREELYREKELFRTTLLSVGDGVVTTDRQGVINFINKVAVRITGLEEEEVKSRYFSQVFKMINECMGKEDEDLVAKVLQTGRATGLAYHTLLIDKVERHVPITDSVTPIMDERGQTSGVALVFRDVTKEKEQQERVTYLSYFDSLTGLYNRRFMEEELVRLDTSKELPYTIIIADINGLKLVNDVFGHEEGDKILKKAAEIIQKSCRKGDLIARWGEDEFLALLYNIGADTAENIIDRIKIRCQNGDPNSTKVNLSLGYAVKEKPSESLNITIKEAEECMYRCKLLERNSYRHAIIDTMISALFAKSVETEEHAERLQKYCLMIGQELKLAPREMDELALLAVLHDIGKVAISDNILKKSGPLTQKEWEEMKKHSQIGYRIARNTPELAGVAEYILSHHEHWDGNGYPRGLKGNEIPILCRILSVVDAYDAMTNDRCYREAMGRKRAIDEIKQKAGTQFDPEIVNVFLKNQYTYIYSNSI